MVLGPRKDPSGGSADRGGAASAGIEGAGMRQRDSTTWACSSCGAGIPVPRNRRPITLFLTTGDTRERVVTFDHEVAHRCTPDPDDPRSADLGETWPSPSAKRPRWDVGRSLTGAGP
jgi:hypothetical protein